MSDQASGDTGYIMTPDGSTKKPSLFGKLKDKTRKAGSKIKSKVKKNPEDGSPIDHDGEEEEDTASDDSPSPTSSAVSSTPRDFESEPSRFSGAKDQSQTPDVSGLSINEPTSTPQTQPYGESEFKSDEPVPAQGSRSGSDQEPSKESYQEPSYKSSQEPSQESYQEPSYKSSQEPSQESYQEPSYKSSQEPSQESYQEPSYKSSQEPSQESYQEPSYKSSQEPSQELSQESSQGAPVSEKASSATQGVKDSLYGGAAAAAGALGYDAYKKHDQEKPVADKASDATSDFGSKAQEVGDSAYGAATDAKDSVAEQTKDTFENPGSEPTATDKAAETTDAAESKAYEAKDALQSKAADVNNATDDSETYTQKATNAAQPVKESVEGATGVGTAAEGPSLVEKAKQTAGFDSVPADTPVTEQAQSKASEATDTIQSKAYEAKDAVGAKAADLNNATDDSQTYTGKVAGTAQAAKDSATEALNTDKPSEGPSLVEKVKQSTGLDNTQGPKAVDNAKQNLASAVDTAQNYGQQVKGSAVDTATPNQDHKALSEKITETLGALPAKAQETAGSVTQSAKSSTPGTATDAHSGEPASPGILGKLGGLFGYGTKAPEHHDATATPTTATPTTTPPSQ